MRMASVIPLTHDILVSRHYKNAFFFIYIFFFLLLGLLPTWRYELCMSVHLGSVKQECLINKIARGQLFKVKKERKKKISLRDRDIGAV